MKHIEHSRALNEFYFIYNTTAARKQFQERVRFLKRTSGYGLGLRVKALSVPCVIWMTGEWLNNFTSTIFYSENISPCCKVKVVRQITLFRHWKNISTSKRQTIVIRDKLKYVVVTSANQTDLRMSTKVFVAIWRHYDTIWQQGDVYQYKELSDITYILQFHKHIC